MKRNGNQRDLSPFVKKIRENRENRENQEKTKGLVFVVATQGEAKKIAKEVGDSFYISCTQLLRKLSTLTPTDRGGFIAYYKKDICYVSEKGVPRRGYDQNVFVSNLANGISLESPVLVLNEDGEIMERKLADFINV